MWDNPHFPIGNTISDQFEKTPTYFILQESVRNRPGHSSHSSPIICPNVNLTRVRETMSGEEKSCYLTRVREIVSGGEKSC